MLEHLNTSPKLSERVLILGGSGFIGQNIIEKLSHKTENIVSLGSKNLDLTAPDSVDKLKKIFNFPVLSWIEIFEEEISLLTA